MQPHKVLNPRLYQQLLRAFGEVRIANAGQPFVGSVVRSALADKAQRLHVHVTSKGECYQVCCPFCGDGRFRLWIAHRWGTSERGIPVKFAAICYNEQCHVKRPDFYRKMCDMLDEYIAAPKRIAEAAARARIEQMVLPGNCIPFKQLAADHPAVAYLSGRGFDQNALSEDWEVMWRTGGSALGHAYRIIIPIYAMDQKDTRVLVGWQSRYFDVDVHGPKPPSKEIPKYMTSPGLRKSAVLYNGWRAAAGPLAVVGEGPLDAIKAGPYVGVAILGKSASLAQESLLWTGWLARGAPVIVMLDNDANDTASKLKARLGGRGGTVLRVQAPHGKDPGDCTTAEIVAAASAAIAEEAVRMTREIHV